MESTRYEQDHEDFRAVVREFVAREVAPNVEKWDADRLIPRDVWLAAGKQGLLGIEVPEEFGGGGIPDFRYRCVITEELARVAAGALNVSISLNDDIVAPYLLELTTDEQKRRWLPKFCAGELITAIAMTEPGAGSDLRGMRTKATRTDGGWRLTGSKTFITNGIQADLVIVAAQSAEGFSLFVVERDTPGFERGRKLDKIGMHAQDTAELFFTDVFVPDANLIGTDGAGLRHLMQRLPRERLAIALAGLTTAEAALQWTLDYTRSRQAFGRPVADFQNTRFVLAEVATEVDVTRAYLDKCVLALNAGTLSGVDAAKAKWWASELGKRTVDRCLQLFGGYGYMTEYPIARAYLDTRVHTIYGGTTEIMKEIISRDLVR